MAAAIHASAVAINGHGILLLGKSGSGKSDLALRLIDRGAMLVCDDYCFVRPANGAPAICAVPTIAGKIEVRGIGIVEMPYVETAPLRLALRLDAEVPRMADDDCAIIVEEWRVPGTTMCAFEGSAAIKAELLLRLAVDAGRYPVRWPHQGTKKGVK